MAGNSRCKGTEAQSPHACGKLQVAGYRQNTKWKVVGDVAGENSKGLGGYEGGGEFGLYPTGEVMEGGRGEGTRRLFYSRDPEVSPSPLPANIELSA